MIHPVHQRNAFENRGDIVILPTPSCPLSLIEPALNVLLWRETEHFCIPKGISYKRHEHLYYLAFCQQKSGVLWSQSTWCFSRLVITNASLRQHHFTMQSYYAHGGQSSHMTLCLIYNFFSIKPSLNYYLLRQRQHSLATKTINIRFALLRVQTHLYTLIIKAKNFKGVHLLKRMG